jgi:H+/Cl- antiporter ClcA
MNSVVNLGKLIIVLGAILIAAGLLLLLLSRTGLPIGRLPGDIMYRRRNFAFYFPLTTSILLSIVLSLVFYFLSRMHR